MYLFLSDLKKKTSKEIIIRESVGILIWFVASLICLESLSKNFHVALGSIFAIGGIGSATTVLALKSTVENVVGGLTLRLQDKCRVGDKIALVEGQKSGQQGYIMSMNYLYTKIRLLDNSIVDVPNHTFIQKTLVNWSRTPFRVFDTEVTLSRNQFANVKSIVGKLKHDLSLIPGVEAQQRDIIVSAKGFFKGDYDDRLAIRVRLHMVGRKEKVIADIRTNVIDVIAKNIQDPEYVNPTEVL